MQIYRKSCIYCQTKPKELFEISRGTVPLQKSGNSSTTKNLKGFTWVTGAPSSAASKMVALYTAWEKEGALSLMSSTFTCTLRVALNYYQSPILPFVLLYCGRRGFLLCSCSWCQLLYIWRIFFILSTFFFCLFYLMPWRALNFSYYEYFLNNKKFLFLMPFR